MHTGITRRTALGSALGLFAVSAIAAPESSNEAVFMQAAAEAVDRVAREDGFSGVILVAQGTQVLLRKAAGLADRERNIANTPETKFPLASVSKQFTAAAVMMLVDEGKVALIDPILKFFPEGPSLWKDVTIQHLLNHSSGIADYWVRHPESREAMEAGRLFTSNRGLIELAFTEPLAFATTTGFEYSNVGYSLLTVVVERASGQSFGAFLQNRIFAPLNMRNTGFGTIPDRVVFGYPSSGSGPSTRRYAPDFLETSGGAGGIYSTLDDMHIWSQALEGDGILERPSRDAMFSDYGYNYGFGWRLSPKFRQKLIWHTGNDRIFTAIFDRFPSEQLTVIAMSNAAGVTGSTATLLIEGRMQTFPANPMRKLVEQVERLYFGREP